MADQTTTPATPAPVPLPFYLQPGFLVGVLGPICTLVAMKFGLKLDPAQLAAIIGSIGVLVLGLLHHGAVVTAAQINATATTAAAATQAAASTPATAADALNKV